MSYHYDPEQALDELNEDNLLPNPVLVRDMIFRAQLAPEKAREVDLAFEPYLARFGEAQKAAREVVEKLVAVAVKH